MKKFLLYVASVAMLFACSSDKESDFSTGETEAGLLRDAYRRVSAEINFIPGSGDIQPGTISWDLIDIFFNVEGTDVLVIDYDEMTTYGEIAVNPPEEVEFHTQIARNYFALFPDGSVSGVNLEFGRLQSSVEYTYRVMTDVLSGSGEVLGTNTLILEGSLISSFNPMVDLSGTVTQSDYNIVVTVEYGYVSDEISDDKIIYSELYYVNSSNTQARLQVGDIRMQFIGSTSATINGLGGGITLAAGNEFSDRVFWGENITVSDLNSIRVDLYDVVVNIGTAFSYVITVDVKDIDDNILGSSSVTEYTPTGNYYLSVDMNNAPASEYYKIDYTLEVKNNGSIPPTKFITGVIGSNSQQHYWIWSIKSIEIYDGNQYYELQNYISSGSLGLNGTTYLYGSPQGGEEIFSSRPKIEWVRITFDELRDLDGNKPEILNVWCFLYSTYGGRDETVGVMHYPVHDNILSPQSFTFDVSSYVGYLDNLSIEIMIESL
ncbi:MAG: hypothetical protein LIO79_10625 [Rikenellaceae bacterium]|nr:hypothetical protein [Rikenellaceae bacterium]